MLLQDLYIKTPSTIREKNLYNCIDKLLHQFFQLLEFLDYTAGMIELITQILARYEYIFLEEDLRKKVKKRFQDLIEKTVRKHSELLIYLSNQFTRYFSHY